MAKLFLFQVQPFGDAFLALTMPVLNQAVELAFNAAALFAIAVLSHWHVARFPELKSSVSAQLWQRIAITAIAHHLYAYLRRQREPAGAAARGGRPPTASKAGAVATPCAADEPAPCSRLSEDGGAARPSRPCAAPSAPASPRRRHGPQAAHGPAAAAVGKAPAPPSWPAPSSSAAEAAGASDAPRDSASELPNYATGRRAASRTHPAAPPAPGTDATPPSATTAAAAELLSTYSADLRHLTAPGSAAAAPPVHLPPYVSPIRRRTTRIKIPWAEPEQLQPGYEMRLAALAEQRGLVLSGVYVRAGCVELVLDEEVWETDDSEQEGECEADGEEGGSAWAACGWVPALASRSDDGGAQAAGTVAEAEATVERHSQRPEATRAAQGSAVLSLGPPREQGHGAGGGRQGGAGQGPAAADLPCDCWDLAAVIRALGVGAEAEGGGGPCDAASLDGGAGGAGAGLEGGSSSCPHSPRTDASSASDDDFDADQGGGGDHPAHLAAGGATASYAPWPGCRAAPGAPAVLSLLPRVVLLPAAPPQPPPQQLPSAEEAWAALQGGVGAAATGAGEAGHAAAPAAARLTLAVSYPGPPADAAARAASLQVCVRGHGRYLPCRTALRSRQAALAGQGPHGAGGSSGGGGAGAEEFEVAGGQCGNGGCGGAADGCEVWYDIELLVLPSQPGAMLLECRWPSPTLGAAQGAAQGVAQGAAQAASAHSAPASSLHPGRCLPLLAVSDPEVARELGAAVASWAASQAELDDLLLDLATWAHHAAAALAAAAPAPPLAAAPSATPSCSSSAPSPSALLPAPCPARLPARLGRLGAHLLSYALACGWGATAARIRREMAALGYRRTGQAPPGAAGALPSAHCLGSLTKESEERTEGWEAHAAGEEIAAVAAAAGDDCGHGGGGGDAEASCGSAAAAAARAAIGRAAPPSTARLALRVMGLQRRPADEEAEEAAYQAFAAPLMLAQAHVMQAVEALSLLALLFRARSELLSPSNLTTLAGCGTGTATFLAWLLLPHGAWARAVEAAKLPRYVLYCAAKIMIGYLGFPTPPGLVPYQRGAGMLVMEGVLLPGSCLLPWRTALLVTLLKWPLAARMMTASAAAPSAAAAVLTTGRVVVAALATTLACHVWLRAAFERQRRQRAGGVGAVASAGGGGGGEGNAKAKTE